MPLTWSETRTWITLEEVSSVITKCEVWSRACYVSDEKSCKQTHLGKMDRDHHVHLYDYVCCWPSLSFPQCPLLQTFQVRCAHFFLFSVLACFTGYETIDCAVMSEYICSAWLTFPFVCQDGCAYCGADNPTSGFGVLYFDGVVWVWGDSCLFFVDTGMFRECLPHWGTCSKLSSVASTATPSQDIESWKMGPFFVNTGVMRMGAP